MTAKNVVTKISGKVFQIILDRPDKYNALTLEMYRGIINGLQEASNNRKTTLTVLTGTGDYFSSGADLGANAKRIDSAAARQEASAISRDNILTFVGAIIEHKKPLIALVNGPVVGIACAILGLFDLVYCSDRSTFHVPFATLGLSCEGCSSFTFPQIMGLSMASEMLVFGKKISTQDALRSGLIAEIFPHSAFVAETSKRVQRYSELPPQSLMYSKGLIRDVYKEKLHEVNRAEAERLYERGQGEEFKQAVQHFLTRKSKM